MGNLISLCCHLGIFFPYLSRLTVKGLPTFQSQFHHYFMNSFFTSRFTLIFLAIPGVNSIKEILIRPDYLANQYYTLSNDLK